MTAEQWLPVPGYEGRYEISSIGRVRTIGRTIIRRNGYRYTVRPRLRRICVHRRDGSRYVALAVGRRGEYVKVYPDRLIEQLFTAVNNSSSHERDGGVHGGVLGGTSH